MGKFLPRHKNTRRRVMSPFRRSRGANEASSCVREGISFRALQCCVCTRQTISTTLRLFSRVEKALSGQPRCRSETLERKWFAAHLFFARLSALFPLSSFSSVTARGRALANRQKQPMPIRIFFSSRRGGKKEKGRENKWSPWSASASRDKGLRM